MIAEHVPDTLLTRLQEHLPELLQYVVTAHETQADSEEELP